MPVGYLIAVAIVASGTLLSLAPIRRPWTLGVATFLLTAVINESPVVGLWYLALSSLHALVPGVDRRAVLGLAAVVALLLLTAKPILLRRGHRARQQLALAVPELAGSPATDGRTPWTRILLAPLPIVSLSSRVRHGIRYGTHRRQRLDAYTPRHPDAGPAPVLIHLPGGAFCSGPRSVYSRPLLHTLNRRGWVCVSASHRLRPASYADMLDDVRRVIGWVREHAGELGADRSRIVLAGSSSGAHLALSAAFTTPASVCAVIGLYGYYGSPGGEGIACTPAALAHPGIPPVLIIHGTNDTLVPVASIRELIHILQGTSLRRVAHAELMGGQHSFDLVYSPRFCAVIDAVEAFARTPPA